MTTRKFDGRNYQLAKIDVLKSEVEESVKQLRKSGKTVRVTKRMRPNTGIKYDYPIWVNNEELETKL